MYFFFSLFDDESKPIPTDSMMKYPTTKKKSSWICSVVRPIISTVRWMFFTCKSSLLPEIGQAVLRLKKSTNDRFTIQGNPCLEMDCPLGNLPLDFHKPPTDTEWSCDLKTTSVVAAIALFFFEVSENYASEMRSHELFCSSFRVSSFHKLLFQVPYLTLNSSDQEKNNCIFLKNMIVKLEIFPKQGWKQKSFEVHHP